MIAVRDDQYAKLKAIAEKLADVVIHDTNPEHWTGTGKPSKELTQQERGDAYWCRKLAASSLSVLVRVYSVTGMIERAGGAAPAIPESAAGETDLDREVAVAEREAQAILKRLAKTSRARQN